MKKTANMHKVPAYLDAVIEGFVARDLRPQRSLVHLKVGAAAILGGVLSLTLCGQFGVGFTSFAAAFSDSVHDRMGVIPCALLCGTLYAVFPLALLRFVLCTTLQFKGILRRQQWIVVLWFGSVGSVLASVGHHGANLLEISLWLFAALTTTFVGARLTELVSWSRGPERTAAV